MVVYRLLARQTADRSTSSPVTLLHRLRASSSETSQRTQLCRARCAKSLPLSKDQSLMCLSRRLLLKLKVNKDKSAVDRPENRKFLGFSFIRLKTLLIRVAPQSIRRFKDKIRKLTKRSWSISMERRINEINKYIRGWMNYFKLSELPNDSVKLDSWIRRRLRMCVWKQWKNPKTRIRKLIGLGIYPDRARKMGGSRKGSWVLSRTTQLNMALSNAYWRERGLISLVDIHGVSR